MKPLHAIIWMWMCTFLRTCICACMHTYLSATRCFEPSRGLIIHNDRHTGTLELHKIPQNCPSRLSQTAEIVVNINDGCHSHVNKVIDQQVDDVCHRTQLKLRNFTQQSEAFDSLNGRCYQEAKCSNQVCLASVTSLPFHGTDPRKKKDVLMHAEDFLKQYFESIGRLNDDAHRSRWAGIQEQVLTTGTYQLSESELIFGAKLAWRNAARCIGRIQWTKLRIFDCRSVTTTNEMFEAMCNHIKYGTNNGNIRSAITIFPQRTDGKHDYRVWNRQIIGYAGYINEDGTVLGDPANAEFTGLCLKLGWHGPRSGVRTRFDVLPLVLSANGNDPDYFDIPEELVLEVPLKHPTYEWFEELQLKWFALPLVSYMVFDCGGLQFTAAPFNGWYMGTEIGARNLCDVNRYNLLETIAVRMGLDTRTPITLWKDKAMIEANVAVLHSFQIANVTITDHHTASECFMRHYENEMRERRGCPADWPWIVPPISGSATAVFHQEMALYHLKPSYDAQDPAWRTHTWKKKHDHESTSKELRKKFRFKQIAWAVKFALDLSRQVLSHRIKVTVLFASETGTSHMYAKKLGRLLDHTFQSKISRMDQYSISNIQQDSLVLVVTSTSGNGDPPENGKLFTQNLNAMRMNQTSINSDCKISLKTTESFMEIDSQTEREDSKEFQTINAFRPLKHVRFAVFALGSSIYPNFCAFGRYVDKTFSELGGERIMHLCEGDEMCGQEQAFRTWSAKILAVARETFRLDDDRGLQNLALPIGPEARLEANVRLIVADPQPIETALNKIYSRNVTTCNVLRRNKLTAEGSGIATLLLELNGPCIADIAYEPGDHLGIFACNRHELVEGVLGRIEPTVDFDTPMQLQIKEKIHTPNGIFERWIPHDRYYSNSLRMLFTRFLDITTPPTPDLLQYFASIATDMNEKAGLNLLVTDFAAYENWKQWKYPNLLEVLEEFRSVKPYVPLLIHYLGQLQPRFYSISSSPLVHQGSIHLTVEIIQYRSQGGAGPIRFGVCSNYLNNVNHDESLYVFVRSAPNFHMPPNDETPMILVGPGTGIAPFRGFWQHRYVQKHINSRQKFGRIWLFFGCRQKINDLYRQERKQMIQSGVLEKNFLALSREVRIKKTYVQDLMRTESSQIYNMIVHEGGHIYVCGDRAMADGVCQTLKHIICIEGDMLHEEVEIYMRSLKDQNRYHEDIFGMNFRGRELNNQSRKTAGIGLSNSTTSCHTETTSLR